MAAGGHTSKWINMTADKDSLPSGQDTDAAIGDSPGGSNFQQTVTDKGQRGRRGDTADFHRENPSAPPPRRGDIAISRDRRAHGRHSRAPRTGRRAFRNPQIDHRIEVQATGKQGNTLASVDERRSDAWGFGRVIKALRSPYFMNIGVVVLFYAITFQTCFDLASVISRSFVCLGAKAAFAATVDLIVNEWTPSVQAFLAGRIARWIGLSLLVALLPVLTVIRTGMLAKLRSIGSGMFVRLRGVKRGSVRSARNRTPPVG